MDFEKDLKEVLKLDVSTYQLNQFQTYYRFLTEYNKVTNLTRITNEMDVYYKHFYDSLTLTTLVDFNKIQTLCDMGAGAGFPSIPLKILYPHLHVTIVDSLGKRIQFLTQLVEKLQLVGVELFHERCEVFALKHQLTYDVVTARALGHLALILEMGMPMLKVNGLFIAPKGGEPDQEIQESNHAIDSLGGNLVKVIKFDLPNHFGKRSNLLIKKQSHITGYPRPFAQMSNKPL